MTAKKLNQPDRNYAQRVFFENSLSPDSYFYSSGKASGLSTLKLVDGKLPVDSDNFVSAPNSLRLEWQSSSDLQSGWFAEIGLYWWRNRTLLFPGKYLWIWLCALQDMKAAELPKIALRGIAQPRVPAYSLSAKSFSVPLELSKYAPDLKAGKWTRIKIPLKDFETASADPFDAHRIHTIVLLQGKADDQAHTLLVDDIRVEDDLSENSTPSTPENLAVSAYERHFDLIWEPVNELQLAQYVIYRSIAGAPFRQVGVQRPGLNRFCDYVGDLDFATEVVYRITARTSDLKESAPSREVRARLHPMSDDEFLTMVEAASLRFYTEGAEANSGMACENRPGDDDLVALGASGFGVMALVAGAERGLLTKDASLKHVQKIINFLEKANRYHGAWPHFMSGSTGCRLPVFGQYENGADLVETSFMIQGLLTARQYFKNEGAAGRELYERITKLWEEVDWAWFSPEQADGMLYWHWSPEYSFAIAHPLIGWNETLITYLLAIASPTHPIPASAYYDGWASQAKGAQQYRSGWGGTDEGNHYANGNVYEGIQLKVGVGNGGPLFYTHYSFIGLDPHDFNDRWTNYFDNNRNISLINHAYCARNPKQLQGYGPDSWGITAVDGPRGYKAFEPKESMDDGTIAPTGAVSAMPYTPEESLAALKHYYRDLGAQVWDIYGFQDSFNLQENWFSGIQMGLNQAPMTVMIENYRSGIVWKSFMENPEIQKMIGEIRSEMKVAEF